MFDLGSTQLVSMKAHKAINAADRKYGSISLLKLIPLFSMAVISVFTAILDVKKITEHRGKERGKIRNEIKIVIKNYCLKGCLFLNEIINFLGEVKDYCYPHYKHQRENKGAKELPDNVPVKYYRRQLLQALSDILLTVFSFHDPNVPSSIFTLASLTRLR